MDFTTLRGERVTIIAKRTHVLISNFKIKPLENILNCVIRFAYGQLYGQQGPWRKMDGIISHLFAEITSGFFKKIQIYLENQDVYSLNFYWPSLLKRS